ncbi:MAG: hypothetical protein M0Q92_10250 [Methanoregula sp.]|jgi:hypothetical protein|nr:hypothetical protein [Methanoregula sp.]
MTQYNDLYVRDNFSDTGVTPSQGDLCQSPDIIPYQNEVLTWDKASSSYPGPDIGKSIINNGINNIYVRSRNLNAAAGSGHATLYYTNYSLNLCQTNRWVQLQSAGLVKSLPFVDGSGKTTISPNGIAISNPSFLLTGLPPGPHYCMIAVVQTTAHPVVIPPSFASNSEFARWVQNNPAVGWRNISYAANTLTQLSRTTRFGNVNLQAANFVLIITGRGFVTGTKINSQCTDTACPINDNQALPQPDTHGDQIISFVKNGIPGSFWGDLVVTATSPGGKFPSGASLTIAYYQIPNTSDKLDMAVAQRFIMTSGVGENSEFKTSMLIKLGECTIRVTDNPLQIE